MSFLAPLFLLGALAVIGPVLFHLIRRTTRDCVPFSSLMFLQPTPPRLTQRSRIENWLLLLLRVLALALLALAFARPFWKNPATLPPVSAAGGRTVVLLDVSASLRRDGLWLAAVARADTAVREAAPGTDLSLMAFDRATRVVLTFEDWRAMDPAGREDEARARLEALAPSWFGTDLASALMTAAETLAGGDTLSASALRRIVLVSDVQEGSRLEAIQSYEWPKGVEFTLASVAPENPGNAGLQLAAEKTDAPAAPEAGARVRIANAVDSPTEMFQVGWADEAGRAFAGDAVDVYVPPGQSRLATVPWPPAGPAAGRLLLTGDAEAFDNLVSTAPLAQIRVNVLHLGQNAPDDARQPLFFLQKALPQSRRRATDLVTVPAAGPVPPEAMARAGFVVITEPLDPGVAAGVRKRMEAGASVLLVLTGPNMAATVSALAGVGSMLLEEMKPQTYAMLGEIDFRHPLFAPFADPRFSDFTKIRFHRYRKLDPAAMPGVRVPARFDSGDPALLETDIGRGRLVVLTSAWVAADSQLAVSSKFPALLASLLEWSGASAVAASSGVVGDPLSRTTLGVSEGVPVAVRTPDGTTFTLAPESASFTETREPGLYAAGSGTATRLLPVNLDPSESRTTPMTADDFERLGVPLARAAEPVRDAAKAETLAAAAENEGRQKLWRWFLLAALAVLFLETVLAGRTARRAPIPAEAAP